MVDGRTTSGFAILLAGRNSNMPHRIAVRPVVGDQIAAGRKDHLVPQDSCIPTELVSSALMAVAGYCCTRCVADCSVYVRRIVAALEGVRAVAVECHSRVVLQLEVGSAQDQQEKLQSCLD